MAAFALYVLAAPPGVYWLDAAELSAAAVGLGVAPAPGFPLYCVLARAASLVPVGELAFRVHLLGAGCAAASVLVLAHLVCESCRDDVHALVGAAVAGALLAVSAVFLRQATVAGVYAPTAALLAGALVLLDRVARGADARWGLGLAVVWGLGLGLHVTFVWLAPVVIVVMAVRLYRGARWPLLAPLAVVAVAGALVAYLPVRSAAEGMDALGPGELDRAGRLLEHVSAMHVRSALHQGAGALDGEGLAALVEGMADHLGPLAPLAALLGLAWLARQRRSRWLAAALAVIAAGDVLLDLWLGSAAGAGWRGGVPLALAASAGAGAGVAWLSRRLGQAGPFAGAVAGVLLVVPPALVSVPAVWPASAPGGSREVPRAWAEAALAATPPRGLALVQDRALAAGLVYATAIEGARPDVVALVRRRLGDEGYARAARARVGLEAGAVNVEDPIAALLSQARPVAWELGPDGLPPGMAARIATPLVTLVPADRVSLDPASRRRALAAAARAVGAIFTGPGSRDRIARQVHARALVALGRLASERGEPALAEELMRLAGRAVHARD